MKRRAIADRRPLPSAAVRVPGLRYVSDRKPGIVRLLRRQKFVYRMPDGTAVRAAEELSRIRHLAIPPAWKEVWICPVANGHIQATGRDARGRKQYRYHEQWRTVRDSTKYDRLLAFGKVLPHIRARVAADLRRPGVPREKVLATVVRLMEMTLIRVGNDEYAATNGSYGLTTMHNRHARVSGERTTFEFKGKSGKKHRIDVRDRTLAKLVRRCQELPGQELFGYVDKKGRPRDVTSGDVNRYLRDIAGSEFSAKDIRTWAGTVLAATALRELKTFHSETHAKRQINKAVEAVARLLGNTPAICRKSYIHPHIFDCYRAGQTIRFKQSARRAALGLRPEEIAVIGLLRRKRAEATEPGKRGSTKRRSRVQRS
jgi:DNA topoisomerase-1